MMGLALWRSAIPVLISVATGCGYDANAPEADGTPPVADANEGLWIASGIDPAILRLGLSQLRSNGRQVPSTTVTTSSASLLTVSSLAFDEEGTLWIASAADSLLLAFSPQVLATSGLSVASTIIAPIEQSLRAPAGIAFDRLGRLWVANVETNTIVRFDPGQLAVGGAPTPAVTIDGLSGPTGLAFDASGALWVASSLKDVIFKFEAAKLDTSGFVTPDVVLSASDGSLSSPFALAFDAFGKLWVGNVGGGAIVAFSPDMLAATGSPTPEIVITSLGAGSVGLAFDAEGSLWVAGGDGALYRFAQTTLGATGAPEPSARLLLNGHTFLSGIAFWPMPVGLPIT